MTSQTVSADVLFDRWKREPGYAEALSALDVEYSVAAALIAARLRARLTQAEVAARIGSTQSAVARMESGRCKLSQSSLEKYAEATGSRLRITLEPLQR